ncbi:MAG TPA: helix-turn-helix transcriptional regulator [Chloroflexota bacterium]|nr:helix-turn-helix transcriptional regulator [Chloroflexota bacterium]
MQSRASDEQSILRAWGGVIRRYRQWQRLSRRELAARAGISTVYLGEIERGEKDPSSHSLCLIADALDAPLAELYLRVAARLDMRERDGEEQNALPLAVREAPGEFLDSVPLSKDETAFDVYKIVRLLRSDQQLSLLVLARSLMPETR